MSKLTVLKDKDPKEVARLLSAVSGSLLPNPRIDDVIHHTGTDPEFVKAVLTEIRSHLGLPGGDISLREQSRIFAFLSEELSKAVLADADINNIKNRLADKGELHPSQYQVRFESHFTRPEVLGVRKTYVVETVNQPDRVSYLRAKYLHESRRITISIREITSRRPENKYILIVVSYSEGHVQNVGFACRAYLSDVDLSHAHDPVDALRAFINIYGATFRYGSVNSKFMLNEVVSIDNPVLSEEQITLTDGSIYRQCFPVLFAGATTFRDMNHEVLSEVILGFVLNMGKYIRTLRKHHAPIDPEAEAAFGL